MATYTAVSISSVQRDGVSIGNPCQAAKLYPADVAAIWSAVWQANLALNALRDEQVAAARAEITTQFEQQLAEAHARIAELESGSQPGPSLDGSGVPTWVGMGRFREALIDWGIMPEQITAMLQQLPDEIERAKAINRWEFFASVRRDSPLVEQVRQALNRTSEETDQLFRDALAVE